MSNTQIKYISKYVFGSLKGLNYSKKNLKVAMSTNDYIIKDVGLYGFRFIEIKNNKIKCSVVENNKFKDYLLTLDEFWLKTKNRKNQVLLIKNI
ncbi:hypothetical protein ACWO4B_003204 [Clostridium sporogenes]